MEQTQTLIDIRSDVLTHPPKDMLKAMSEAELRNDSDLHSLDDITATKFEKRFAKLFGKEAALIFPTGTMCNIAAVILHAQPGSEVIIPSSCHSVERQSSSFAVLAGVQTRQVITRSGKFTIQELRSRIRKEADHITFPNTDLIFIENGTFRGQVWKREELREVKKVADEKKVKIHIDGARIFNALAYQNIEAHQISDCYDTLSVCLSKGLCCPLGAVMVGSQADITKLKHIKKGLGGGIWHTGLIAAAGEYALDHMLPTIKKDNEMGYLLATELSMIEEIEVEPSQTHMNMVHWSVKKDKFDHGEFKKYLLEKCQIKIKAFDEDTHDYRFVVYRGIREDEVNRIALAIRAYFMI